jgi:hypothetical protein
MDGQQLVLLIAGVCVGAVLTYAWFRVRAAQNVAVAAAPTTAPVVKDAVNISRPYTHTVEGLEIQYEAQGLVRSVRVGAMNSEHKELLMTMDAVSWRALPNAQKQEVLAAARSTWASKMCPDGPDIAYVVLKTETGEIIGRADPHSVRIL